MNTPNPVPVWREFETLSDANYAEQCDTLENNRRALDHQGADLLDMIANHHRDDWQDPKFAIFARRVLRMVSDTLRTRA
jgi:hypothetical protein